MLFLIFDGRLFHNLMLFIIRLQLQLERLHIYNFILVVGEKCRGENDLEVTKQLNAFSSNVTIPLPRHEQCDSIHGRTRCAWF